MQTFQFIINIMCSHQIQHTSKSYMHMEKFVCYIHVCELWNAYGHCTHIASLNDHLKSNETHCRRTKVLGWVRIRVTWTKPQCSCRGRCCRHQHRTSQSQTRGRCLNRQHRRRRQELSSSTSSPWVAHPIPRNRLPPGITWCNGTWLHTISKFTWLECFMFLCSD